MIDYDKLAEGARRDGVALITVGAVIADDEDRILIMKRNADDFLGGYYEVPGGKADPGETIPDALKRELYEETSLQLHRVLRFIDAFDYHASDGRHCRQFNFHVSANPGEIVLTEHQLYRWLPVAEALGLSPMTDEMRQCLILFAENHSPAEG